jgi:nucleotide-binding universal stress UspA family protein
MNILLAVDGSRHSRWAVDLLRRVPLAAAPIIRLLTVVERGVLTHPAIAPPLVTQPNREMKKQMAAAKGLTTRTANRLRRRWKRVRSVVESGPVVETILSRATDERTDLILMGSRGLSNIQAFVMGSVSQQVVVDAPCSVLIVKKNSSRLKKLLVAVDDSQAADDIITFLTTRLRPDGLEITLLHVHDPDFVYTIPGEAIEDILLTWLDDRYCHPLAAAGFSVQSLCVTGHPAAKIVEIAGRRRMDLVILGSRGLTGLKRLLLGSVSRQVVKYGPGSVLVVRGR